jgi:hypothetical protein
MKRLIFFFVFLFSAHLTWAEPIAAVSCRVVSVEGSALVKLKEETQWKAAETDQLLGEEALIQTTPGSVVQLAFEGQDDFEVEIGSNSRAQIQSLAENKKWLLENGQIYVETQPMSAGHRFEVKTPSAVCAVRGTQWDVEYGEDATSVNAFENEVSLQALDETGQPKGQAIWIKPGFASRVKKRQLPEPAFHIKPERLDRWKKQSHAMRDRFNQFEQKHPGRFKRLNQKKKELENSQAPRGKENLAHGQPSGEKPMKHVGQGEKQPSSGFHFWKKKPVNENQELDAKKADNKNDKNQMKNKNHGPKHV